jgi:hypothetical protein
MAYALLPCPPEQENRQAANLGAMVTTEFIYVAHVQAMPANRAELAQLLKKQITKAVDGLHYDDADEAIREQLQSEFK